MSEKLLIKGGTVLSLDRAIGNMVAADVLVEDGTVTEVGESLRTRNAQTVDATNAIVMPGFVDSHRHAWHSLFRNVGTDTSAVSPDIIGPHYTAEHVYAATLIGLLGAVEAGITSLVDWADIPPDESFAEAALQAHADSGLRTVFVAARARWDSGDIDADRLRARLGDMSGSNQTFAFGPQESLVEDLRATSSEWALGRELGLRLHAHVGSSPESRGLVARLNESGLLGEDVTLVHCTNLDDGDLDAIKASGALVSLTPSAEMIGGLGPPPLQALIDRGIRPGLGSGSTMEAPGDIFAQMRAANSMQHAALFDLKLAGKAGVPNLLSTREVIRYATIDGARAAGLGAVTGSLSPGKRGDIVVLRTDRPNIAPINDPIGAVVWGMDTSNIDWVFANGRALVSNGELTANVSSARDLAIRAQREVSEAAGLVAAHGAKLP